MAFDVITPTQLGRGPVTPIVATFYEVPDCVRTILKTIDICNVNSFAINVTVYLVPDGDVETDDNTLVPNIPIAANSLFQWGGAQVLNKDDKISAVSSSAGVTINISGGETI